MGRASMAPSEEGAMKAAVWHGKRDIRVESRPDPAGPGPGEALVEVALAGICGTDLHEYTDGPQYIVLEQQTLGHEMSGTVVAVGDGVRRARPGDRVAIMAIQGCGECRKCRRE